MDKHTDVFPSMMYFPAEHELINGVHLFTGKIESLIGMGNTEEEAAANFYASISAFMNHLLGLAGVQEESIHQITEEELGLK